MNTATATLAAETAVVSPDEPMALRVRTKRLGKHHRVGIFDSDDGMVAEVFGETTKQAEHDAARMVRRVNVHADLLAAVDELLKVRADPTFQDGARLKLDEVAHLNGAIELARIACAKLAALSE